MALRFKFVKVVNFVSDRIGETKTNPHCMLMTGQ